MKNMLQGSIVAGLLLGASSSRCACRVAAMISDARQSETAWPGLD